MMTDHLTPYILTAVSMLIASVAYLLKQQIAIRENIARLQTGFEYYLDRAGRGAAIVLDTPNPTPDEIRRLLRKYAAGGLNDSDEGMLIIWAAQTQRNAGLSKTERFVASQLLDVLQTKRAMANLPPTTRLARLLHRWI